MCLYLLFFLLISRASLKHSLSTAANANTAKPHSQQQKCPKTTLVIWCRRAWKEAAVWYKGPN